jgi:hypothetical protein
MPACSQASHEPREGGALAGTIMRGRVERCVQRVCLVDRRRSLGGMGGMGKMFSCDVRKVSVRDCNVTVCRE